MLVKEVPVQGAEIVLDSVPGPFTVCLDKIFRESMKKVRAACTGDIIVRCNSLPALAGSEKQLSELFDNLIGLIFDMSVTANRIFLFVEFEEENGISGPDSRIYRDYSIRFHSNFSADDDWKQKNAARLSRCDDIISDCGGIFIVNKINNTGCLFIVKLPANQK